MGVRECARRQWGTASTRRPQQVRAALADPHRPLPRGRSPGDLIASSDPAAASGLKQGERIFHEKFGYGRITNSDGAKLTVAFDKAGVKKVVESFVKKA